MDLLDHHTFQPSSFHHLGFNNKQGLSLSLHSSLTDNNKVNKSCLECRRRKIRCDGNQPCQKCIYYQIEQCQFYTRKQRKFSSQRRRAPTTSPTHAAAAQEPLQVETTSPADVILRKIFPSQSIKSLQQLSRAELLQLVEHVSPTQWNSDQSTPGESTVGGPSSQGPDSDEEREWNEPQETQNPASAMCDDVNGLSLRVHRRSYMGVSSTHAILRTMFRLKPSIQADLRNGSNNIHWKVGSPAATFQNISEGELKRSAPSIDEGTSIDAYFDHVQGIVPLLDEADFRTQWSRGDRSDRPWLALLNMVLALGSLAAGDSDDQSHYIYYVRAKEYLDFQLLGTGCVESLQALCLLGGCYLHYKNAPNMAYTIMGAAYRIAIALGLHREPTHLPATADDSRTSRGSQTRRQIWWSLFCLDTWGSMTLGRPTLGRWDPETMNVCNASNVEKIEDTALSLDCARTFCIIATRVQHRFAQLPPITTHEIQNFDLEVLNWHKSLPASFQDLGSCPSRLLSSQYVMQNRYCNLRLLIYRPVLLSYANRAVPFASLKFDEQRAIQDCRSIARAAIDQTASMMQMPSRLRVWSGVWYLYQASMVMLLSMIVDREHEEFGIWRSCVENALLLFDSMASWSRAAERSKQVVGSIYDTCGSESVSESLVDVDYMRGFDVEASWQLDVDIFGQDWNWDTMNWEDELSRYPEWSGE